MDLNNILNNIKKELDKKSIEIILKENYINFNRSDIYFNFIRILSSTIFSTYLGSEYIKTKEDIIGHYNWCFNDTCNKFIKMGVDFTSNKEVYNYFLDYYEDGIYNSEKGKEYIEQNVSDYFRLLFEFRETKPMISMMAFIDIYNTFNSTFTKLRK